MAIYAVTDNNIVINVIVADTKEVAEEVTGKTCIESTEDNPASIGSTWNGINFIPVLTSEPIEEPTE